MAKYTLDFTASEINERLSKLDDTPVSMELLWENASPNSEFAAQSIDVNTTGYDLIYIQSTGGISDVIAKQGDGVGCALVNVWARPTNSYYAERYFQIYNLSVKFEDAYQQSIKPQVLDAFVINSKCKPYRIYGIKGVQ